MRQDFAERLAPLRRDRRRLRTQVRYTSIWNAEEAGASNPRMADEITPDALLARVAERDRKALAALYDRFAPHMLGIIRHILSNREESEKVLEEIFLRLWREAGEISRARASVAAWLVLGARTEADQRLRARRAAAASGRGRTPRAESWPLRLALLPRPEAIARLDERRPLLQKVLGQLPKHQLRALELVAFAGRAETELEGELGEPPARVRAELRAATRFLRHRRRAVVGSWAVSL
jgi:RNA polymerase sigma-70 factor, ECF subfamily